MFTIPPLRADWVFVTNTYDGTFVVDPGSWHSLYAYREAGYKADFDLEVLAGGNQDIDFFICDQGNYTLWSSGYTAWVYVRHDNVVSYDGEFVFPYSSTWHFVFSNTFSVVSSKTVQFTCDLYQWQTFPAFPGILPIVVIGIGITIAVCIVGIIVTIVLVLRKRATTTPPSPNEHRCPTCNTPLTGHETYCGDCGTKLQDKTN
jgi:hypothetical protein